VPKAKEKNCKFLHENSAGTEMISMVMSYYNRLRQFDFTLSTIAQSAYKNYEIVIVDDFSDQDHDPSILQKKYSQINIRIIRMKDVYDHKWYINPCIPYNVGFRASQGSAIIIQNPECCHVLPMSLIRYISVIIAGVVPKMISNFYMIINRWTININPKPLGIIIKSIDQKAFISVLH
jgi:hypothetical protein